MSMVTTIDVSKIKAHSVVEGLFPVDKALRASIRESMEKKGYSSAFPLHVIRNGADGTYLIYDGLTRLGICRELGIKIVPALVSDAVTDDEEILREVIEIQSNRRSSSDEIQFICIERLSEMAAAQAKAHQGTRTDLKKPEKEMLSGDAYIARTINKSEDYVKKARAVMKVPELREKVIRGELSLKAAYRSPERTGMDSSATESITTPRIVNATECPDAGSVEKTVVDADGHKEENEKTSTTIQCPKEKKISVSVSFLRAVLEKLCLADMDALYEISETASPACLDIIKEVKEDVEQNME